MDVTSNLTDVRGWNEDEETDYHEFDDVISLRTFAIGYGAGASASLLTLAATIQTNDFTRSNFETIMAFLFPVIVLASSIATYLLAYYEDRLVLQVRELRRFGSSASRFGPTDLTIIGLNLLSIISAIYAAIFLYDSSNGLQLIEFLLITGAIYTFSLTIYNALSKLREKKVSKFAIELIGFFAQG